MGNDWVLKLDKNRSSILKHVILWIGYYLLFLVVMSLSYQDSWKLLSITNLLNVFVFIFAYYSLRYIQLPYLYQRGHKVWFGISLLISTLACYSLYWGIRIAILEPFVQLHKEFPFVNPVEYLIRILRFYSPTLLLLIWEYQHKRKQDVIRIRSLEKEKLNNELRFLKAQINPHFLFNTLNNLYSFVVTESPKASDMIDRLSGILEYVFKKSQNTSVLLSEELNTIEDYLALEKIRYGDRLTVEYQSSGDKEVPVSPLIILSIVENAFKHGASGDIDNPIIKIDIDSTDKVLKCNIWNTKSKHVGELNDAYKSGIGIGNIKRQLNLIYPNRHKLHIQDNTDDYNVILTINAAA